MRRDNLSVVCRPQKLANLRFRVDGIEARPGRGAPEPDHPVRGAAASGEEVVLEGTPRERLHSAGVGEDEEGRGREGVGPLPRVSDVPYVDYVIVASRSKKGVTEIPLEPTNFRRVAVEGADVMVLDSHVVVEYMGIAAAAA